MNQPDFTQRDLARQRSPDDPPLPRLRKRTVAALGDPEHRETMEKVSTLFRAAAKVASSDPDLERLRRAGREIRRRSVDRLAENLQLLEDRLSEQGWSVHHASGAAEARRIVTDIALDSEVKLAVKSKSMATEEIGLNHALEAAGIEVFETDLGEYIVQLAGERPAHIIAPAVHKSRSQVASLFSDVAGEDLPDEREALTAFARRELRDKFLRADMGITGVNFAAADTGTLVMVSNEGNLRMSVTMPRVHVALMPVEKVLSGFRDLATMLPLLVRSATGQRITSYVSMLSSPRRPGESDGPAESHLVILDSGRMSLLDTEYREMLRCIRCAACLNVCPVYTQIGGHAYGGAYSGPMGAVLTPLLEGNAELAFASSLCGACTDACPVGIPLHRLLYTLRADRSRSSANYPPRAAKYALRAWSAGWRLPQGFTVSTWVARKASWVLPARHSGVLAERWVIGRGERGLPLPAKESFRTWWKRNKMGPREAAQTRALPDESAATHPQSPSASGPEETDFAAGHPQTPSGTGRKPDGKHLAAELAQSLLRNGISVASDPTPKAAELLAQRAAEIGGGIYIDRSPALDRVRKVLEKIGADHSASPHVARVGITSVWRAVVETGSLLLMATPESPRRTSLLPETHLALVSVDQIRPDLDTCLSELLDRGLPSAAFLISGPSKSADIELTMTSGVHGPRNVVVFIST